MAELTRIFSASVFRLSHVLMKTCGGLKSRRAKPRGAGSNGSAVIRNKPGILIEGLRASPYTCLSLTEMSAKIVADDAGRPYYKRGTSLLPASCISSEIAARYRASNPNPYFVMLRGGSVLA
jgi:hypothetical protein